MFDFVSFIPRAIMQGIPLLFGSTGEILTVCHEPVTGAHVGPGMLAVYFFSETWR